MFKQSLKPHNFLTKEKIINFNKRNSDKFRPSKGKEVRIYSPNVIQSKRCDKLKFTNYYSDSTDGSIITRLEELSESLSIIKSGKIEDDVNFNNTRITEILRLFIPDFNVEVLGKDRVRKVTLEDYFGFKGTVRIYFIISEKFDSYEIIAIDLFHLLIPSRHRGDSKEKVLSKSYEANKNNRKCLTDFFEV